ncbi:hypothetical protein [Nonomuraea sp. NPDC050691]|uniref:hypothetical protein n=1 Tax=Nonomuraea sp. NPDC050691 TaxID=3155661 RepID=UPI0033FBDA2E
MHKKPRLTLAIVLALVTSLTSVVHLGTAETVRADTSADDQFIPLTPTPVLDTRSALGTPTTTKVAPNASVTFQVTGVAGIPATGVSAAALNLIAIAPEKFGWFTVHASDTPVTTSSLTYHPGESTTGQDLTRLTGTGKVTVKNNGEGPVHIAVAVRGYFLDAADTQAGNEYYPVRTDYLYDTRPELATGSPARTTPIDANSSATFDVAGQKGIPAAGVNAVALNVVAAHQNTAKGWLSLYPSNRPDPRVSTVDYVPHEANSNFTITELTGTGQLTITNHGSAPIHVSITLRGYFMGVTADGEGSYYRPVATQQLVNTLQGIGTAGGSTEPLAPGAVLTFDATRFAGVYPDEVTTAAINVNARQPTAQGWLSVYAEDSEDPSISSVNFDQGGESTNGFDLAIPGFNGKITIANHSSGTVHVQVSVRGYFILPDDPENAPVAEEVLEGEGEESIPVEDGEAGTTAKVKWKDYKREVFCESLGKAQLNNYWVRYRRYSNGKSRVRNIYVDVRDEGYGTKESNYAAWRGYGGNVTYFYGENKNGAYSHWWEGRYIAKYYPTRSARPYVKIAAKWNRIAQPDVVCRGYINVY